MQTLVRLARTIFLSHRYGNYSHPPSSFSGKGVILGWTRNWRILTPYVISYLDLIPFDGPASCLRIQRVNFVPCSDVLSASIRNFAIPLCTEINGCFLDSWTTERVYWQVRQPFYTSEPFGRLTCFEIWIRVTSVWVDKKWNVSQKCNTWTAAD
jgi:hypothetical protein